MAVKASASVIDMTWPGGSVSSSINVHQSSCKGRVRQTDRLGQTGTRRSNTHRVSQWVDHSKHSQWPSPLIGPINKYR